MKHHEFLTMAAASRGEMERSARAAHEDRDPRWHSVVTESIDPVAIESARTRGLLAFTVERWWKDG